MPLDHSVWPGFNPSNIVNPKLESSSEAWSTNHLVDATLYCLLRIATQADKAVLCDAISAVAEFMVI
jgi:hypothetical protein